MIKQIGLKNFTAFENLSIDFSPKINVVIGENGTGKTHVLKAAYGLCSVATSMNTVAPVLEKDITASATEVFLNLYCPLDKKLGKMRRHGAAENAEVKGVLSDDNEIALKFHTNSKSFALLEKKNFYLSTKTPVFIPTKEVLSLTRCLAQDDYHQKTIDVLYDAGYTNLAKALLVPVAKDAEAKINDDPRLNSIIPRLVNLIGGRYEWDDGIATFQAGNYEERASDARTNAQTARMYQDSTITKFTPKPLERYSSDMTAEGFRKIGILHQLLLNDSIQPGVSGPLFWDEPESNLNPKLMKLLVQILLELSRNGQQIILATHDYVLLKWFDLLVDKEKDDYVRFHVLRRDQDGSVKVDSVEDYRSVSPNAIADTFNDLTKEQVNKKMGGLGK